MEKSDAKKVLDRIQEEREMANFKANLYKQTGIVPDNKAIRRCQSSFCHNQLETFQNLYCSVCIAMISA